MTISKKIPTFVLEEHNEAFYAWHYCLKENIIPPSGNTLFHVDEHSDMSIPRFNTSINSIKGDLAAIRSFTAREVGIATFIFPAIYQGLINEVYWFRQKHQSEKNLSNNMYVRSYNSEGKKLIGGKVTEELLIAKEHPDSDVRLFGYYLRRIEDLREEQNVLLDIDLDYFSCSGNPNELEEIYVEITESQYEEFRRNPYHRLRYLGYKMNTAIKNNRYYLVVNQYNEIYPDAYPFSLRVPESVIEKRINTFTAALKRENIQPSAINICRSRFSGYTPADQWEFIESRVVDGLRSLYDISLVPIGEI